MERTDVVFRFSVLKKTKLSFSTVVLQCQLRSLCSKPSHGSWPALLVIFPPGFSAAIPSVSPHPLELVALSLALMIAGLGIV